MLRRNALSDLVIFGLLVAIGVAGRLGQPAWCFTPTAAVAVFAGFYFSARSTALFVPLFIMAISDLWLPAYDSMAVMAIVYAVFLLPVLLGKALRRKRNVARLTAAAVVPATAFWLISNLAIWMFHDAYPTTMAGLIACYTAAIPFFRNMLAGDAFYLAVFCGCYAVARGSAYWAASSAGWASAAGAASAVTASSRASAAAASVVSEAGSAGV